MFDAFSSKCKEILLFILRSLVGCGQSGDSDRVVQADPLIEDAKGLVQMLVRDASHLVSWFVCVCVFGVAGSEGFE
jgi:hypothetical protein